MDLEDNQILALIEKAKAASETAYCPYSNYPVGAAVLTFDNRVYSGCNVENAAFSQTIHAEENAVSQAIADGLLIRARDQGIDHNHNHNQVLKLLAVYAPRGKDPWPCCNCRQFLSEFGTAFWVVGLIKEKVVGMCFAELVPHLFSKDDVL